VLTDAQVGFYRDNGYLILPDVLSPAQVAAARAVIDEAIDGARPLTANDERYDLEPGHSAEQPLVRRLKNPDRHWPLFADIVRSAAVLDRLEPLVPVGIRLLGSKLNTKAARAGSPVEWHQDFAFHPHTNDDVLAIGLPLDDMDEENGCLLYVPGSHLGPVLDHHQDGVFVGAVSASRYAAEIGRAVPAIAKAGGMVVHHGRMLHGSAPNRSERPRRLLLYDLAAVDAWPVGWDPGPLDAYDARILRGTPTIEPRVEAVQVRIPLPKPERAASIFELQEQAREGAFRR
jgi:ectoine hydroxylase-related dioxygenase (phytanoyl-CoA dioxygenase family)